MSETHTGILSAFCDGEAVDPELFAAALADPRGRDALVDFARLRAAVISSHPPPASLARLRPAPRRRPQLRAAMAGAAAMLVLMALTFALLPRTWFTPIPADAPPAPTRVVRYQPGVDWLPEPR
jgi:hypothetical protein